MKVRNIHIQNFKRFTDLKIEEIPETTKMVVLVGPNGCGKTSVFEAFNYFTRVVNTKHILRDGFSTSNNPQLNHYKYNFVKNDLSPIVSMYKGNSYCSKITSNYNHVNIGFFNNRINYRSEYVMYFRTAYRNDPDFSLNKLENSEQDHSLTFIDNDQRVMRNYQKILLKTIDAIYLEDNNHKSVADLRNELIGKIQQSVKNIFGDLMLNNIQSPLKDGSFYFKKGTVENYHYKNLSSGEKAVFDLLLDLIVNLEDYKDSLFFIDEPEAHIHTKLQGQVVEEIYNIIPDEGQLWITTHSLGVMTKAKELSIQHPGSVVFLDFDGDEDGKHDFDQPVTIKPASISSTVWKKFMSVALDGMERQMVSEITIMCEGGNNDFNHTTVKQAKENERNNDFDSVTYNKIFNMEYPYITFESVGSCNNLERDIIFGVMSKMLNKKSKIYRLRDKDDATPQEIEEYEAKGMLVTSRRNIEGYLLDDELLKELIDQEVADPKNQTVTKESRDEIWKKIKTIKEDSHQNIRPMANRMMIGKE